MASCWIYLNQSWEGVTEQSSRHFVLRVVGKTHMSVLERRNERRWGKRRSGFEKNVVCIFTPLSQSGIKNGRSMAKELEAGRHPSHYSITIPPCSVSQGYTLPPPINWAKLYLHATDIKSIFSISQTDLGPGTRCGSRCSHVHQNTGGETDRQKSWQPGAWSHWIFEDNLSMTHHHTHTLTKHSTKSKCLHTHYAQVVVSEVLFMIKILISISSEYKDQM